VSEDERFRTVAGRGEAAVTVRGSAFVGHVAPARTVEVAEDFVAAVVTR
jgi:putative IMPACT (imprinted ancient) family translation regulator